MAAPASAAAAVGKKVRGAAPIRLVPSNPAKGYPVYTAKDVRADRFVVELARYLKRTGKIEVPKYVDLVKTGVARELAPYNPDWFFVRAASLARRLYVRPGTGVGGFSKVYSKAYRRGSRPEHQSLASRSILRHALQQLEKIGLVEKNPNGGRQITSQGRRDLDRIAAVVNQRVK